jgi:hypothetical protein
MSDHTPHARLLNVAGRSVLEPLGLRQRGRTRFWVDDNDWWLVLVEFQPSDRSRGSYLNVGVMWLWQERDDLAFDVGYRLEDFVTFRNKAQFEREAARLVAKAAEKVEAYRAQFASAAAAADYLGQHCNVKSPWSLYNAGVACGLAGRAEEAGGWLDQLLAPCSASAPSAAEDALRSTARQLRPLVAQRDAFRLTVEQVLASARESLRLPRLRSVSFDADA